MYHFSGLGHDFPDPSLVVSHLASRIAEGLSIGVNFLENSRYGNDILAQNYPETTKDTFKKRLGRNLVFSARILSIISTLLYNWNKFPRSQINLMLCFRMSRPLLGSSELCTYDWCVYLFLMKHSVLMTCWGLWTNNNHGHLMMQAWTSYWCFWELGGWLPFYNFWEISCVTLQFFHNTLRR